jgi:hypothetical protein
MAGSESQDDEMFWVGIASIQVMVGCEMVNAISRFCRIHQSIQSGRAVAYLPTPLSIGENSNS